MDLLAVDSAREEGTTVVLVTHDRARRRLCAIARSWCTAGQVNAFG